MTCISLIPALLLSPFLRATDGLIAQERENLCAQARAESLFDPSAVSRSGARGWGQFMRPTWREEGARVGCPEWDQAFDPLCNMSAQRNYMRKLLRSRICQGDDPADRWAIAYACYNGGAGWRRKERRLCAGPLHPECDPSRWWGHQETVCVRNASACHETRTYNERIRRYGATEIP